jgi:hypothetical protein
MSIAIVLAVGTVGPLRAYAFQVELTANSRSRWCLDPGGCHSCHRVRTVLEWPCVMMKFGGDGKDIRR